MWRAVVLKNVCNAILSVNIFSIENETLKNCPQQLPHYKVIYGSDFKISLYPFSRSTILVGEDGEMTKGKNCLNKLFLKRKWDYK